MDLGIVGTTLSASGELVTDEPKAATSQEVESSPETSAVEDKNETEAVEVDETKPASDSDSEEAETEDSEEALEKAPKKKSGFEKRIEKLNKKATAAEMRAAELEARLAALEKPATAAQPEAQAESETLKRPNAEDFDTNADYVEALFDYSAKKSAAQAQAEQARVEQATAGQKAIEKFNEAKKLGAEKFDDFDDVTDLSDFGLKPTPVFTAFMQNVDDPSMVAALMYHLGSNRDEFTAILKMSEIGTIKALTKIESKLNADVSTTAQKAEPKVVSTKAPAPIKTVSGAKSTKMARLTDDMSYDDFKRIREAQLRTKR
jgi:hypothetical protein